MEKQIEYINTLLPLFGCSGVGDDKTLFNKSTIVDWSTLRDRLNSDMVYIRSIFPTKSLNLSRLDGVISTEQQAMALLRGLLKIVTIPYVTVRKQNSEFLRLNLENKTLMYYIVQTAMTTAIKVVKPVIKQIQLNSELEGKTLGIVKKFYIKYDTPDLPECHTFTLAIGGRKIAKSSQLVYDGEKQMYELQFFSKIVNLFDLPKDVQGCLFLDVLADHKVYIRSHSNVPCQLYMESYESCVDKAGYDTIPIETYVEYVPSNYKSCKNNILSFAHGMCGPKYEIDSSKYSTDKKITDLLDTKIMRDDRIQLIRKYL